MASKQNALVLGMMRTESAAEYSAGGKGQQWDLLKRSGRDTIRIGELLAMGYNVFSVGLGGGDGKPPVQHLDADFTLRPSLGTRDFAMQLQQVLKGTRLNFVLDEWVYIPIGWSKWDASGHGFYHNHKFLNFVSMAQKGLLEDGCQVFVPMHTDAVRTLYSNTGESKALWDNLQLNGFTAHLMGREQRRSNPLWAATQGSDRMLHLSADLREQVKTKMEEQLSDVLLKRMDNLRPQADELRDKWFVCFTWKRKDGCTKRSSGVALPRAGSLGGKRDRQRRDATPQSPAKKKHIQPVVNPTDATNARTGYSAQPKPKPNADTTTMARKIFEERKLRDSMYTPGMYTAVHSGPPGQPLLGPQYLAATSGYHSYP